METGQKTSFFQSTEWKPKPRGKFQKGKPLQQSDEIVYSKGPSVLSMPSLSKQLEGLTTSVIGLQYVWEYRSPSLSVAPLYHCKVCNVHQFQGHMLAHITGWKHCIRYIKKEHPDKITFSEEDVVKDSTLKKTLKEVTAELETSVGRGQLKVILKEPADVPAFKGLLSASQKQPLKIPASAHFIRQPRGGFGGYSSMQRPPPPPDYSLDQGNYYGMGHNQDRNDYEGYSQVGPSSNYHDYREAPMNALEPPHRPEGGEISNTLLSYLDTFKIESESDAQLVLKVTQKLTDILMEYRLGHSTQDNSMSQGFTSQDQSRPPPHGGYPTSSPNMSTFSQPYSGYSAYSGYSGSSKYSGASGRF